MPSELQCLSQAPSRSWSGYSSPTSRTSSQVSWAAVSVLQWARYEQNFELNSSLHFWNVREHVCRKLNVVLMQLFWPCAKRWHFVTDLISLQAYLAEESGINTPQCCEQAIE